MNNNAKSFANNKVKKIPTVVQEMSFFTKYHIGSKIGHGSFGEVFKCRNNNNNSLAIKFEKQTNTYPQLRHEYKVYEKLRGVDGIANVHCFGETAEYRYIIMDLLGPSLESLFNYCGRRFSVYTTFSLADQMLNLIEYMHDKKFIHRDIKPENFVLGPGDAYEKLFLIDFGLAKQYITADGSHIPYKTDCSFIGTARYASINSQRRIHQSRRDDLESIGYVLVYFLKGALPWQNHQNSNENHKQRKERILEMKVSTPISELCANLPFELQLYLKHTRERIYEERPNYAYLRRLCRNVVQMTIGENNNHEYDWVTRRRIEQQQQQQQTNVMSD